MFMQIRFRISRRYIYGQLW